MDIVTLNVRGRLISTLRTTLCRFPDSVLGRMFADDQIMQASIKDKGGNYFIDRDAESFVEILNMLTDGKIRTDVTGRLEKEVKYWFPGVLEKAKVDVEPKIGVKCYYSMPGVKVKDGVALLHPSAKFVARTLFECWRGGEYNDTNTVVHFNLPNFSWHMLIDHNGDWMHLVGDCGNCDADCLTTRQICLWYAFKAEIDLSDENEELNVLYLKAFEGLKEDDQIDFLCRMKNIWDYIRWLSNLITDPRYMDIMLSYLCKYLEPFGMKATYAVTELGPSKKEYPEELIDAGHTYGVPLALFDELDKHLARPYDYSGKYLCHQEGGMKKIISIYPVYSHVYKKQKRS